MSSQGRGRGQGHGGRGRGSLSHMVVDHCPKALTVDGFIDEEKVDLLQHFPPANQGSKFKDRRLQISWHKAKVPSVSTETEEEEVKEEVNLTTENKRVELDCFPVICFS